jgi:MFS family permease
MAHSPPDNARRVDTCPVSQTPTEPAPRRGNGAVETLRAVARAGTATGRAVLRGTRAVRGLIRSGGAQESGLADLVELCALNAAADAFVAVALANTVFFNVPLGQARGHVGLYLLVTMAPFALLAPVIGPLLDRLHSRRFGLAFTLIARVVIAWMLATRTDGLAVYPIALCSLVASRAFGIARAAVVPRALPSGTSLLTANSRVSLVAALGAGVGGPLAVGIDELVGITWLLRVAAVIFALGVVLCLRLPAAVDSAAGEVPATGLPLETLGAHSKEGSLGGMPAALRGVLPLRALGGFIVIFLAFRLSSGGGHGAHAGKTGLAFLALAVLVGQSAGVILGNRLGRRRPEWLVTSGLLIAVVSLTLGALMYTRTVALWVALASTLAAALAKLGLDAVIQRDVADSMRNSAFARSETALQLAWVGGGALGLVPWEGWIGFSVAAAGMLVGAVLALPGLRSASRARRLPAQAPAQDVSPQPSP